MSDNQNKVIIKLLKKQGLGQYRDTMVLKEIQV